MPVLVKPTKTKLTWGDFGKSSGTFGNEVAEAGYDSGFQPENFTPREIRKLFYLPATFTVRVWPVANVYEKADLTDALLAHEQLHYDVGIVCARALARELEGLSNATPQGLADAISALQATHMFDRAGKIQEAYDTETEHGKDRDKQQKWQDAMKECLANRNATRLKGFAL